MKRKVLFALIAVLAISVLTVANVITVGFVGKNADDNRYVQLDSVAIENLTKNWRQVAIYPDTIVELQLTEQTAVPEVTMPRFGISDLAPNPAEGVAYFNLSVTKSGKVVLTITDLNGRSLLNLSDEMQTGVFAYRVTMETATTYVLRATNGAETSVAKIINRKPAGETSLTQIAEINSARVMQKIAQLPENKLDSTDLMQYTGFVTVGDSLYTSEQVEQKQIEDETIELIFHLCETIETEFSVTECEKFVWNEIELTESGDFYQTFTAVNGCDSVVTLHLTINQPAETILTEILCFGETYTENGFDASESGTFTQELKTVNGCDSIVTLNLTVLPKIETEFSVTECDSYTWNDQTYTESGDYQQVLQTAIGCDSTVTLHLTINNTLETTFDVTICFGETYTENGFDASESGIFTQKLKAAKGCDSIVTLNLTVLPKIETEFSDTTLVNPYTWDGTTYEVSGDYTKTYTAANGCDSTVTFHYRRGFIDERDGTFYKVVKIGDQIWMAENLRYLPQIDGQSSLLEPKYRVYGYTGYNVVSAKTTENYKTYGVLYNWLAAMESALASWKLPTQEEWDILINAVGTNGAAKLAGCADLWNDGILKNSTDFGTSGFDGLPAGYYWTDVFSPGFQSIKTFAGWWTATTSSISTNQSYRKIIRHNSVQITEGSSANSVFGSVRYLFVPLTVGTTEVSEITPTTATVSSTFVSTGAGVTEKGFVYSTTENPEIDGEGVTKVMAEGEDFTATVSAGSCGTTYYVRAYAANTEEGTVYGAQSEVHFGIYTEFSDTTFVNPYTWDGSTYEVSGDYTKTYPAANGCDSTVIFHYTRGFTDERDGNFYKVVKIGDQIWMAENLRYLPQVYTYSSINSTDPRYYVYAYTGSDVAAAKTTENYRTYGALYNWSAAMESVPASWKLPTKEEWDVLKNAVGETDAGARLAGRADLWEDGTLKKSTAFGDSGFDGLPAGWNGYDGSAGLFSNIKTYACWWTETATSATKSYYRYIGNSSIAFGQSEANNYTGLSVRCLFVPLTVGTTEVSEITPTTATVSSTIVSSGAGVTEKGFVYSATENPEIGGEGVTKVMAEGEDFTATIPASCGTTYYVRAYATNTEEGTVYSEQKEIYFAAYTELFVTTLVNSYTWDGTTYEVSGDYTKTYTTANGCDSIVTFHYRRGFVDERDGNFYKVVKIGDQIWMAENLRYLPQVYKASVSTDPRYYVYAYTGSDVAAAKATENYQTYGALYNWYAAMESAPAGWKLPTTAEWDVLKNAVGDNAGAKLAGRADLWLDGTLKNSTDLGTSGFEGLPAGYMITNNANNSAFASIKTYAYWWTATATSGTKSYAEYINNSSLGLGQNEISNYNGYSVRCLFVPLAIGTTEVSEITPTTATVSGTFVSTGAGVTEKGFVYSTSENPEIDGEGVTKVMAESEDFTATIPASCGTIYYVRAYATNTEEGTVYGEQSEVHFGIHTEFSDTSCVNPYTWEGTTYENSGDYTKTYTAANGCDSIVTLHYTRGFTDERDGNFYKVVKIGDQLWMAENLRYLPKVSIKPLISFTDPYYYVYGYNGYTVAAAKVTENYQTYGVLYNWSAAMESAPVGWKLPTQEEWDVLKTVVGETNAGAKLAGRADLWIDGNLKNSADFGTSGFEGLPAGYYYSSGNTSDFSSIKNATRWWTATNGNSSYEAYYRSISNNSVALNQAAYNKDYAFSVRYIFAPLAVGSVEASITPTTATVSSTIVSSGLGVTEKGFVYSATENPEIGNEGVTKVMAEGEDFTVTIPASCGTIYYVRAYATNTEEGTVYSEQSEVYFGIYTEFSDTTFNPYTWDGTTYEASGDYTKTFTAINGCDSIVTLHYTRGFTDERDGNFYKVVKIGDQLWMAENLRYLPQVDKTSSSTGPRYYVYGYSGTDVAAAKATENYQIYGVLYNWYAANEVAPAGWKLPSREEWNDLRTAVGTNAGAKLAGRADLWQDGTLKQSTDFGTFGFEGLPAGHYTSQFNKIGQYAYWWSTTHSNSSSSSSFHQYLDYNSVALNQVTNSNSFGYSVRCLYVGTTE